MPLLRLDYRRLWLPSWIFSWALPSSLSLFPTPLSPLIHLASSFSPASSPLSLFPLPFTFPLPLIVYYGRSQIRCKDGTW